MRRPDAIFRYLTHGTKNNVGDINNHKEYKGEHRAIFALMGNELRNISSPTVNG
jgi:hypothetical protein